MWIKQGDRYVHPAHGIELVVGRNARDLTRNSNVNSYYLNIICHNLRQTDEHLTTIEPITSLEAAHLLAQKFVANYQTCKDVMAIEPLIHSAEINITKQEVMMTPEALAVEGPQDGTFD